MSQTTEETKAAPPDIKVLKQKSVRGGTITFVSQGASLGIHLASTVVLARLLSPADYGIMAMVSAVTVFGTLFRDLGLSATAIQKRDLTNAQQSNLFWVNVLCGCSLTVLLAAAAPLVARFYDKPEVLWVTLAVAPVFAINSVASQSGAFLVRQMRFGRQAVAAIAGGLVTFVVAAILALSDFRYWALVCGQLAGSLITTSLLFALSPFRPGLPQRNTGLKEMLKFGANVTAFDFVNYFHRHFDNVLVGRFWGAEALGVYSRAYTLLMFPITNLRQPITAVAFPALSRLQNEPAAFRNYYLKITSLLALLSMPITAFLFVGSSPVIQLLLGAKWLGVAPIFSWLAIAGFVQPTGSLSGSLLLSLGRGQRHFRIGLFNAICMVICFVIGLPWGAVGVAMAYGIGNCLILYPVLRWSFVDSPVSFRDFVEACAFPAAVSIFAALLASLARTQTAHWHVVAQLGVISLIFVGIVSLALFLTTSGRRHASFLAGVPGLVRASFKKA